MENFTPLNVRCDHRGGRQYWCDECDPAKRPRRRRRTKTMKNIAVGVAESRKIPGSAVVFQVWRGANGWKRDDRFRVFPVPTDLRFIEMGPEEFREKYRTVAKVKTGGQKETARAGTPQARNRPKKGEKRGKR